MTGILNYIDIRTEYNRVVPYNEYTPSYCTNKEINIKLILTNITTAELEYINKVINKQCTLSITDFDEIPKEKIKLSPENINLRR